MPTDRLQPSPENEAIYRRRSNDDPDQQRLIESIRQKGIQVPIVVSADLYVISGHSRLAAAKTLGIAEVPVEVLSINRSNTSEDEWARMLVDFNKGREKTIDELRREAVVEISKEAVVKAARDSRVRRASSDGSACSIVGTHRGRPRITRAKRPFVDAILAVLDALRQTGDLPVSLRAIHYRLLNCPPRIHASKPSSTYRNCRACYEELSKLATSMRLAGDIEWSSIIDPTRVVSNWKTWRSNKEFISEAVTDFLDGYARDLMASQTEHYEIVIEKLTVEPMLREVASRYTIPMLVTRGQPSIDCRARLADRFKRSNKDRCHLFILTDADPDGDAICDNLLLSLRDEFGIPVSGDRVGVRFDQAEALGLISSVEVKRTSPNFRKFFARHGRQTAFELECVPPPTLRKWLDTSIRSRIDVTSYNAEVARQDEEYRDILATKQIVRNFLRTENAH